MDRLVPQLPAGSGGSGGGRASSSATTQRHPLSVLLALQLLLSVLGLAGAYTPLSDGSLRSIPAVAPAEFDIHNSGADALLAPLLVTRVPGTPGSEAAQRHLAGFFERRLPGWSVAWHNTTARTPATGAQMVPFRNIIVRRDPPWTTGQGNEHRRGDVGYLTLVAHYDSLYKPDFIGATDSAAPCAMLLHVARSVEEALKRKWEDVVAQGMADFEEPMGVQILLLDGEEAWVSWSAEDSLYGSRYVGLFHFADMSLLAHKTNTIYTERLLHPGRQRRTRRSRRTKTRCLPSRYLCYWTFSVRRSRTSLPTSSRHTGRTRTWRRSRSGCATWA